MARARTFRNAFWIVLGMVVSVRSQPITSTALHDGVSAPEEVFRHGKDLELQDLALGNSEGGGHMAAITHTLEHFIRQGRELAVEGTGRQAVASLANSLGSLIRPAITAFVGALSMNGATSVTNAITALLGGRSLDLIPPETFVTAPTGRQAAVQQPTREVLRRRPSRRRQRHPAPSPFSQAH